MRPPTSWEVSHSAGMTTPVRVHLSAIRANVRAPNSPNSETPTFKAFSSRLHLSEVKQREPAIIPGTIESPEIRSANDRGTSGITVRIPKAGGIALLTPRRRLHCESADASHLEIPEGALKPKESVTFMLNDGTLGETGRPMMEEVRKRS